MDAKKQCLNTLIKVFGFVTLCDALITVACCGYSFRYDNTHGNIKLLYGIGFFNKFFPPCISSLILIRSKLHMDKVDSIGGWIIVMSLNLFWDVGFIIVGSKWLKYNGDNIYTGNSIPSVFFLILYKVLFAIFVIAAFICCNIFLNTKPDKPHPQQVRRYNSFENQG